MMNSTLSSARSRRPEQRDEQTVPEWIAKHENEAIPPRVKLRIFQKFNKRCAVCTLLIVGKLRPEYDHVSALINGGQHRESNIQLLCSALPVTRSRPGRTSRKSPTLTANN